MSERINLNPMFMQPPASEVEYGSMPMAYVLEGSFPSYFADKPIPARDDDTGQDGEEKQSGTEGIKTDHVKSEGVTIKKGRTGKILLIGTSEILKNTVLDEEGNHPNSQFVLNAVDYLNGRENNAVMRSKTQRFNPLKEVRPGIRTVIKTINIAGLPVLVVLSGLIVWFRRSSRKRAIRQIFNR
jgi:hypothetical protein